MKAFTPWIISLFCLITSTSLAAERPCPTEKQIEKMAEPPFFLSDFSEFTNLNKEQKNKYFIELEKLVGRSKKVVLPSQKSIIAMSTDQCAWENLRLDLHNACSAKGTDKKICDKLENARITTLKLGQARP